MAWNYLRSPNSPSFTHHDNRCLPALKHHDSRCLANTMTAGVCQLSNTMTAGICRLSTTKLLLFLKYSWLKVLMPKHVGKAVKWLGMGMTFVRHTIITDCSTALLLHRTFLSSINNPVWWSSRGRSGLHSKSQKHYNKMHGLINLEENYTCYILHPRKSNAWQIPKRNQTVHQTQAKE